MEMQVKEMQVKAKPSVKVVEVVLSVMTRSTYSEFVEVPADITQAELDALIDARYESVGAAAFEPDEDYWERGECDTWDATPHELAQVAAFRSEHGLRVVERPNAAALAAAEAEAEAATVARAQEHQRLLCLEAVWQWGGALKYVPDALKTEGLCIEAVRQAGWALRLVPDSLRAVVSAKLR